jgi:hypothetical protein
MTSLNPPNPQPNTIMSASLTFNFPISTLIRDSKLLHAALIDATIGPALARRLSKKNSDPALPDIVFAQIFDAQIQLVENGSIGQMTQEQIEAEPVTFFRSASRVVNQLQT